MNATSSFRQRQGQSKSNFTVFCLKWISIRITKYKCEDRSKSSHFFHIRNFKFSLPQKYLIQSNTTRTLPQSLCDSVSSADSVTSGSESPPDSHSIPSVSLRYLPEGVKIISRLGVYIIASKMRISSVLSSTSRQDEYIINRKVAYHQDSVLYYTHSLMLTQMQNEAQTVGTGVHDCPFSLTHINVCF